MTEPPPPQRSRGGTRESILGVGLESSLATISILSDNCAAELETLLPGEAEALQTTLDKLVTKAHALQDGIGRSGNATEYDESGTDQAGGGSMTGDAGPVEPDQGETKHCQQLTANAPRQSPPVPPRRKLSQPFITHCEVSNGSDDVETAAVTQPHHAGGTPTGGKKSRFGNRPHFSWRGRAPVHVQPLLDYDKVEFNAGGAAKDKFGREAHVVQVAREAFSIIDVNNDGYLQEEEVVRAIEMMQEHGEGMVADGADAAETANKMMTEVDIDGDGQIDIDEFVEMMRKGQNTQGEGVTGRMTHLSYNHRMSQLARNVLLAHQKKIENSVIGDDFWMIHPMSNAHAVWDVLVSVLILLTVITMPLSIGWDGLNDSFFAMNLTVDFIFLLDVCKNFCTGFVDENDAVIMDAKVVRRNYLTGFFATDLCSSVPLDLILRASGASESSGAVTGTKQSLKMLKLLRMAKLFRLLRISRLFRHIREVALYLEERLSIRISDGFTKLLRLGIGALVLGHWIGCFNFMLVRLNDFPEDSWVVYAGLQDTDAFTQWSWAFFKALAQMIMIGFETPPFTNASCDTMSRWCGIEHWITLLCLYVGAVFYSLLISSISTVLQTANLASRQFEEKLTVIDDYMRSKRLPAAMREKVKEYFHLQHSNGKLYNEAEILDMVTPVLRREIKQFNGRDVANKVPLLSSVVNRDFSEEMTSAIEPAIAFNDEVLMREKTTGDEMYFIQSGVVEIYVAGAAGTGIAGKAYVAIGDGCYFGEVSLLLGVRRTASARTRTQCVLYKISRSRLLAVLEDFPAMGRRMRSVAGGRVRRLEHYLDPGAKGPLAGEDEVDSEDSKTALFGADADRIATAKAEEYQQERRLQGRGHRPTHDLYSGVRRRGGGGVDSGGGRGGGGGRDGTVLPLAHRYRNEPGTS